MMIEIGQRLYTPVGTYEVEKPLGRGKTAEVYKGVNTRDSADMVALKVAREGMEERVGQNFRREKEVLDRLEEVAPESAYFPRALYQGKKDETPYLVMSLIQAKPLLEIAEVQPGRRLSGSLEREQLALDTATSYAHMLTILHKAGYAASDRKLDDILWNGKHIIVLDWNAVGSTETGQQHDLYQFGLFWHQLLLGVQPPRNGRSLRDQTGWENLTFGTRQILERTLHLQPAARYPDAQTLWQALQTLQADFHRLTGEGVTAAISTAETRRAAGDLIGAFTLLDILEEYFDRGSYPAEAYALWKELQAELAGQWGQIISQGVSHLQEGRFDRARKNFEEALVEAGDNQRYSLTSYRWQALTQALIQSGVRDQAQLATAIDIVQAMDSGAWEKAASAAKQLGVVTSGPLLHDLNLRRALATAQAALDVRDYERATAAYRVAQESWEQVEATYRDKLGLADLRQLIAAADNLAHTEGIALSKLHVAKDKLDKGEQVSAETTLAAGYELLRDPKLQSARSQDISLPPPLDDQFDLAKMRLNLQKKAAPERFRQDRLPVLFELARDHDDAWAKGQIQFFRQELLGELRGEVNLEAIEHPTTLLGYLVQDDEVVSAVQDFKDRVQRWLEEKVEQTVVAGEQLLENPVSPEPIKAAYALLHQALAQVQLARFHKLVSPEILDSLRQQLHVTRQHIGDEERVSNSLQEHAERIGQPLTIKAETLVKLLEADVQAIQNERESARQRWQEIARYYLNAAQRAAEQYDFPTALSYTETVLNLEYKETAEQEQAKILRENLAQEKQELEQQCKRLEQAYIQFEKTLENEQTEIEQLEDRSIQVKVTISHPSLIEKVKILQEAIDEKIGRLYQRFLRREFEQAWKLYEQNDSDSEHLIDQLERKVTHINELSEQRPQLAEGVQELVVKVEEWRNNIRRQQVRKKLDDLQMHKSKLLSLPERGDFVHLQEQLLTLQGLLLETNRLCVDCPEIVPVEMNKLRQQIKDELRLIWNQLLRRLRDKIENSDNVVNITEELEKAERIQNSLQNVIEDSQVIEGVSDLRQLLYRRKQEAFYARIYGQLGERVPDWQEVFALLQQSEAHKDKGEILLPQRWMAAAETYLAQKEYAPALQLAYYARRYYEHTSQEEQAEQASHLEAKALTHLHDRERLHELAQTYLDEALQVYRSEQIRTVPTLDRAMELVGWAALFDPGQIDAIQREGDSELKMLFETWQQWRERQREARLFYERSKRNPPPPLEERVRWLRTAAELSPGDEEISSALDEVKRDAETKWKAVGKGIEEAKVMLEEGRYSQVEMKLNKIQEDLVLLEMLTLDEEAGDKNLAQMEEELITLKRQVELVRKTDELYMPFRSISHWSRGTVEAQRPALAALSNWIRTIDVAWLPDILRKELRDLSGRLQGVVNASNGRDDETLIFTRLQIPILQVSTRGDSTSNEIE